MSLMEKGDRQSPSKPFRAIGHYGSTTSLKSLATESSVNDGTNLKCLDCNGGSLINLHKQPEVSQLRHRSPSLPPIYSKDQQQHVCQDQQRDFALDGLHYRPEKTQPPHNHRFYNRHEHLKDNHYCSQSEEREGETSGYASDSADLPVSALLPGCKLPEAKMSEKTWQNSYRTTPDCSLSPTRRISDSRIGELTRPRWGSVWGQESAHRDPPPPSWLSRLGQSSQVLVINHESASSSDSSTIGSIGSDNKTYLRGQNIPVDAVILRERETKRQKALELQNAIKEQLEEKARQRKEEKEKRLREERLEEERIKREREKEIERFEEEQKRLKEKEVIKSKQAEAMREVLEAAERLAKEQKKLRRKREEIDEEHIIESFKDSEANVTDESQSEQKHHSSLGTQKCVRSSNDNHDPSDRETLHDKRDDSDDKDTSNAPQQSEQDKNPTPDRNDPTPVQVPVSKDVAIVLSGRLEDSELLNKANLQLVNLVLTPTPRTIENNLNNLSVGLNTFIHNIGGSNFTPNSSRIPSTIVENRLLTPSKYRCTNSRDFGTQTDIENDNEDFREKMRHLCIKNASMRGRKDTPNANKRDIEKSTNTGSADETTVKSLPRLKPQCRRGVDSRPQWNANRPGTRYRTQSEKDPHYQRRLRMRRRQIESSDEHSRSPSPDRRKPTNVKSKLRATNKSKAKIDSYDADLSMDSLNSIIPLRTDKHGRITIEENRCERNDKIQADDNRVHGADNVKQSENGDSDIWCGQQILSKLSTLKNGLLMEQMEWDAERCLISPASSEIY